MAYKGERDPIVSEMMKLAKFKYAMVVLLIDRNNTDRDKRAV